MSEDEAGERLAAVVADPKCKKSGVYWSWNGDAKQVTRLNGLARIDVCKTPCTHCTAHSMPLSTDTGDPVRAARQHSRHSLQLGEP